jgi:acyl-CoA dehydrogenase
VRKAEYTLEKKGTWDAMGLRGTCSPAFLMTSSGKVEQIMTQPFAEMASQTVVPVSHLLWAGCWLGTSSAAVSKARAFVRGQALASPGKTPPTALRLAELLSMMQSMRTSIHDCLREYEELILDPEAATGRLTSISYALKMNNLKIDGSMAMPQIVSKALMICGILGYKNDNKFSMGRHIRDAQSAMVMVGNDRILATNANLLLVLKDD